MGDVGVKEEIKKEKETKNWMTGTQLLTVHWIVCNVHRQESIGWITCNSCMEACM